MIERKKMSVSKPVIAASLALAGLVGSTAWAGAPAGDAVKGKATFARCAICHELKPGVNKLGPSLYGVFGRKAGTAPGFSYSEALKATGWTWDAARIDTGSPIPKPSCPPPR